MSVNLRRFSEIACMGLLALSARAHAEPSGFWQPQITLVAANATEESSVSSPLSGSSLVKAEALQLAQATPPAPPAPTSTPKADDVDESALRYFARQGDTKRLEIEIARLRALYPQWTPPANPLTVPVNVDHQLETIWQLYSEGRLAEARQAIAQRQSDEPGWQPPADVLDRMALAEARERLISASEIDQYDTVIRIASENPQLLTCGEVDVLWRVAEAFARNDRPQRAMDAYRYMLTSCDDRGERLATVQNASQLLDQTMLDELLALERFDAAGIGEFASVRDDVARRIVAKGGEDENTVVPAEQLRRVERLAEEANDPADARLLGWYHLKRADHVGAETWFRRARDREDSADTSEGLALALMARGQYADAEDISYQWRGANDDVRKVYLAAAANLLGVEPRPVLSSTVLGRIVAEAVAARDILLARQLGWYARAFEQHETARQWFTTALGWNPDDEPSAYGLALTRHLLGETAGLAEIQRVWSGRSQRILEIGMQTPATAAAPRQDRLPVAAPRDTVAPAATTARVAATEPRAPATARRVVREGSTERRRSCTNSINPANLAPQAALQHGWCLMDANRPMEAVRAFAVALDSSSEAVRRDAAWGQSLAYLRVNLVDEASAAAVAAPQDPRRARELQTSILSQRAAGAFERGRYVETLLALDQRAQLAPERIDLMVLRGYAYLKLGRLDDARRVFTAVAGTGDREGIRGLAAVNGSH